MKSIDWQDVIDWSFCIAKFVVPVLIIAAAIYGVLKYSDNMSHIQIRKTCIIAAVGAGSTREAAIDYCVEYSNWLIEMERRGWK